MVGQEDGLFLTEISILLYTMLTKLRRSQEEDHISRCVFRLLCISDLDGKTRDNYLAKICVRCKTIFWMQKLVFREYVFQFKVLFSF